MDTIKGYISAIRFHNDKNGYTVFSFVCDGNEETVVGNFAPLSEGEMLEVTGEWIIHPVYDRQFKAVSCKSIAPDDEASILRYLSSGVIKGIGPTLAQRIVDEFGKDTFTVLEEQPERLERIKGITLKKAREIGIIVNEKRGYRDAVIFLGRYGIGNVLAIKIYNYYRDDVYQVLRDNPYRLAEDIQGVGFKTADSIAAAIGFKADSEYRISAGILYTLSLAMGQGFMYLPKDELIRVSSELLEVSPGEIEPRIGDLIVDRKLIAKNDAVYTPVNFYTEQACAGMLRSIFINFFESEKDEKTLLKEIDAIARRQNFDLDDLQREAVLNAVLYGISIVTGGPGTGKTTTIKTIIGYFNSKGMDIALAAPTGRAAKRMTEATGYEAKTIHRLLEVNGAAEGDSSDAGFERDEENPLDADVIIVDEMSMVDIFIFKALLKAIPVGARLVMVGDANQLPSVGPGQVLRDLLECECFPVTRLETIYRQEGSGDIVMNAHNINRGLPINFDNKSKDFFMLERNDVQRILANTVELITTKLPPYVDAKPFDIQVLTPMRKGSLGVIALNRYLQEKLNPADHSKKEYLYGEDIFREGDKVMQIKNNYQLAWEIFGKHNIPIDSGMGVFNGDMGRIIEINTVISSLTVEFDDGRRVDYPFSGLDELELAYAITVHKSQGSEYGAVIMPILDGPKQLLNRNLLYTGVTRAKKCLVILGSSKTVEEMIENDKENLRYSGLRERITEIFAT